MSELKNKYSEMIIDLCLDASDCLAHVVDNGLIPSYVEYYAGDENGSEHGVIVEVAELLGSAGVAISERDSEIIELRKERDELKGFIKRLARSKTHAKIGNYGQNGYEEHLSSEWRDEAKRLIMESNYGK